MKHLIIISIFISILFAACGGSSHWDLPKKELHALDMAIRHAEHYARESARSVDSLKKQLNDHMSVPQRIDLYHQIVEYYVARQADSALSYAMRARKLAEITHNQEMIDLCRLAIVEAYSSGGFFTNAMRVFDSIPVPTPTSSQRLHYWQTARGLYSNLANYAGDDTRLYNHWHVKTVAASDTLIKLLPPESPTRVFMIGEGDIWRGDLLKARRDLLNLLSHLSEATHLYGMVCYQIAKTYVHGDQTQYAAYMARAAECDIKVGIRDGVALPTLGAWLYTQNDLTRAFNYINWSLTEAYAGNARMRLVYISQWVPSIDDAYRKDISRSRTELIVIAILLALLLAGCIVAVSMMVKEINKRRQAHIALKSMSRVKDHYIRDFIRLCSAYSQKYDQLSKTVMRKITAGQSQDLLKLVKSGKASESENEEFYRTIDSVFLTIFPDFIESINHLLQPEERFELPADSKTLNPELRIYGFVRLGVTESAKIARILNYSPNTVYAYRNRMRNRAMSHDTFDSDVMNIGGGQDEE